MTDETPAPRRPYSWECAWCKRQYVALDRRELAHVRGFGEYLFCTTHCLKGWQAERVPRGPVEKQDTWHSASAATTYSTRPERSRPGEAARASARAEQTGELRDVGCAP